MDVGEGVLVCIPSAKAEIDTSDECECVVDYNEFLVMCLLNIRSCLVAIRKKRTQ